ncbi:hypothetical protein GF325_13195 [Candidatus Bathyarchaeota archaeon]|nr:hypothetical protein [Candidatus Bathyarchaeota archaeon]
MASEDILVFLAVDKEFTSMDAIIKSLADFFQLKASKDPTDRFNVVFFLDQGPVFLEDFTFQYQLLVDKLNENKDKVAKPNLEGGLFIALTFILDIYKLVSGKYFRILVIRDASMPPITKDFLVNGLLDKVSQMPVFLDFIDVGVYQDDDEQKILNMINTSRGGELMYVTTFQELEDALKRQAEKKEIEVGLWDKGPNFDMEYEHKRFFEDLASDLQPVEQVTGDMKCTVCFQSTSPVCGTDALVQCPACKTPFHDCCLVSWAEQSNIGIGHVFRCPICFYLIDLPEFLVQDILNGKEESYEGFESFLEEIDQDALLMERDKKRELDLVQKELDF